MSSTTPPTTSVPNEGTSIMESLDSDQSVSMNRRFSMVSIIAPLLLISSVSVALGLAPYFRLRQHILRQSGVMQTIRLSIEDGNKQFLKHLRTRDLESAARQIDNQTTQVELKLRVQELDRRYQQVDVLSKQVCVMQGQLDESNARAREFERQLDTAGKQTGAVLGQIAVFMEETQLKEGAPDRYGVARMRELALLLQSSHVTHKESGTATSEAPKRRFELLLSVG